MRRRRERIDWRGPARGRGAGRRGSRSGRSTSHRNACCRTRTPPRRLRPRPAIRSNRGSRPMPSAPCGRRAQAACGHRRSRRRPSRCLRSPVSCTRQRPRAKPTKPSSSAPQRPDARQPARLLQRPGLAAFPAGQAAAQRAAGGRDRARRHRRHARAAARRAHAVRRERRRARCAARACGRRSLARDWQRLFVTAARRCGARRACSSSAMRCSRSWRRRARPLTAHVLTRPAPARRSRSTTRPSRRRWTPAHLATKPFAPLPVLGVPGWWAPNENVSFYDDSDVFRSSA